MYRIQELSFSYGERLILDGIDLSIRSGRFTTIIGPNGAGKTTLMQQLSGYLKPYRGELLYGERPLHDYGLKECGRKIASVPQEVTFRFPFSCLEVVLLGRMPWLGRLDKPSSEDMEIVRHWMERTDTSSFAEKLITELSGGEKQRVVLAKALVQTSEVLLLDEAFSAMDIHFGLGLLNMVRSLMEHKEMTVVATMHDLNMASLFSDDVIALDGGRVVHRGTAEEVMRPDFIHSLFHIRVRRVGKRGLVVLP
jgi:iron complex transport system ATP-binding protein